MLFAVLFGCALAQLGERATPVVDLIERVNLAFFTVLVAFWVVWFVRWRHWRSGAAIVATGALAALAVLPVVIRYRTTHALYGFERLPGEIASFGADVTSLLYASPHLTFWSGLTVHERPEGELFPGVGVLLLIAIVAAISLTMRKRANLKQQDVAKQVAVRREDRVRVVQVAAERSNDTKAAVTPGPSDAAVAPGKTP